MPAITPCLHCGTVGFVRTEHVITAKTSFIRHYCGFCLHAWTVAEKDDQRSPPDYVYAAFDRPDHSR